MADAGVGANLDIQVNVKTIADNSGQLTQELSSLSSKVAQITSGVARAEQSVASLSQTVASIGSSGVTSMGSLEGALKTLTTSVNSNIQASQRLSTQYQALGKQLNNLPAMAQGALGSTQRLAVQGAGAIGQQTVAVRNLQQAMGQMGQTGQSAFSGLGQQIFGSLYGIQFLIGQMQNALNAIERMDVLRASYSRIMGADVGLANVGAVSNQMIQDASYIGQKYGASISDVAGTMVEFARQGRSAQDIRYLTDSLGELRLMLATSTGKFMSMSEAMKSATTLMTQMDLSVYEAIDALKLMSEYDIRAATSFNEISIAMNRFSAAGKVAGMSTEEIIKVSTAFTEIGIGGSRAGTAINAVLSRLSSNKDAIAQINSMNVALTTMENGTLRATSAWEQLVEAYRKVVASGSSTQLNTFLTAVAGARQRAALAAGLNRQLKQSASPVEAREFAPMVSNLFAELNQAISSGSSSVNPVRIDINSGARVKILNPADIKATLTRGMAELRQSIENEFNRTGQVKPIALQNLYKNWFAVTDEELRQIQDANKPLFSAIESQIDAFALRTESVYDRIARLAKATTEQLQSERDVAFQTMSDSITVQRNRLTAYFESAFLTADFTSPFRTAVETIGNALSGVTATLTSSLGALMGGIGLTARGLDLIPKALAGGADLLGLPSAVGGVIRAGASAGTTSDETYASSGIKGIGWALETFFRFKFPFLMQSAFSGLPRMLLGSTAGWLDSMSERRQLRANGLIGESNIFRDMGMSTQQLRDQSSLAVASISALDPSNFRDLPLSLDKASSGLLTFKDGTALAGKEATNVASNFVKIQDALQNKFGMSLRPGDQSPTLSTQYVSTTGQVTTLLDRLKTTTGLTAQQIQQAFNYSQSGLLGNGPVPILQNQITDFSKFNFTATGIVEANKQFLQSAKMLEEAMPKLQARYGTAMAQEMARTAQESRNAAKSIMALGAEYTKLQAAGKDTSHLSGDLGRLTTSAAMTFGNTKSTIDSLTKSTWTWAGALGAVSTALGWIGLAVGVVSVVYGIYSKYQASVARARAGADAFTESLRQQEAISKQLVKTQEQLRASQEGVATAYGDSDNALAKVLGNDYVQQVMVGEIRAGLAGNPNYKGLSGNELNNKIMLDFDKYMRMYEDYREEQRKRAVSVGLDEGKNIMDRLPSQIDYVAERFGLSGEAATQFARVVKEASKALGVDFDALHKSIQNQITNQVISATELKDTADYYGRLLYGGDGSPSGYGEYGQYTTWTSEQQQRWTDRSKEIQEGRGAPVQGQLESDLALGLKVVDTVVNQMESAWRDQSSIANVVGGYTSTQLNPYDSKGIQKYGAALQNLLFESKDVYDAWRKLGIGDLGSAKNIQELRSILLEAVTKGTAQGIDFQTQILLAVKNLPNKLKHNASLQSKVGGEQDAKVLADIFARMLDDGMFSSTDEVLQNWLKMTEDNKGTLLQSAAMASQRSKALDQLKDLQGTILSTTTVADEKRSLLRQAVSSTDGLENKRKREEAKLQEKHGGKTIDEVIAEKGIDSAEAQQYKEELNKVYNDIVDEAKALRDTLSTAQEAILDSHISSRIENDDILKDLTPTELLNNFKDKVGSATSQLADIYNDIQNQLGADRDQWTEDQKKSYEEFETYYKENSEILQKKQQEVMDQGGIVKQAAVDFVQALASYDEAKRKLAENPNDDNLKEAEQKAKAQLDTARAKLFDEINNLAARVVDAKSFALQISQGLAQILSNLQSEFGKTNTQIAGILKDYAKKAGDVATTLEKSGLDADVDKYAGASTPDATTTISTVEPGKESKPVEKTVPGGKRKGGSAREVATNPDAAPRSGAIVKEAESAKDKEIADLRRRLAKALEDAANARKSLGSKFKPKKGGAKKDTGKAERELLQQITQEHQERLQDIAALYKTIRDSEGKIIGYMDRTGGIENQQAVIEEQKRYLVDLKNVHEKMTKNAKDRAKVSRQIAQETVKLLEMERKLYEYQEKIQQNTNKYALEDLDRPHKLAIDTADIESLNALLQQEYDLQLKILDSEMRLTRQDEASVQAMRRKFSTEILKRYEAGLRDIIKVVQQLTDRFDTLQRMSPGGMQDFLLQQRIKYPELFGKGNTAVYDRQVQAITESVARQVDYAVEKANFKMDQLNTRFKQARQMMQLGANNFAEKAGVTQEEAAATYKALSEAFKARLDNKEISQQEYDKLIQVLQEGGATPIRTNVSATEMNQALESFKSNVESTASKLGVDPDLQAKLVAILQDTFISKLQGMFADSETIDPRKVIEEATAIKAKLESELKGELPTSVYNQIIQLLDSAIKSIAGEGGVKAIEMASKYSADIANLQAKMQAGEITKDFFDQVVAVYHQMLARLFTGAEVNADQLTALNEELATKKKALAERASKQTISSSYTTEPTVKMPAKYSATVTEMGGKYNVSPALIAAIIQNESGWKPRAKSPVGARGLMQLMPDTAKWLGVKNAWDPTQNIEGGTKYLAYLLKLFNGDIEKVIASYNAGQGRVQKSIKGGKLVKSTLPEETQTYLQRVLASFKGYGGVATGVAVPDSQLALDTQVIDAQQAELNKLKADFDSLVTITSISDQIKKSNLLEEYTTTVDALIQEIVKGTEQLSQLDLSKIKNWQKVEIPLLEGKHTMMDPGLVSSLNQRIIEISTVVYQITEENYKESMAKLAVLMPHVKGIFDKLAEIPAEVIHEKLPYIQETIASQVVPAAQQLATHTMDDINRRYEEFKRTIADALESGWDEGWSIGEEYGFTSEGWGALQDSIKKRITSTIKNVLWEHLQPKIHEFFVGLFSVVDEQAQQDAIQKAQEAMQEAATEEARKAAQKKMQEALNPSQFLKPTFFGNLFGGLFAGIFSSLLSFAIGALFSDFTEEAQRIAQQQLDSQKDQIRSEGFSWSYSDPSSNVATPTYEFASPTTTESVKIIKVATTINISTDAAMAMASHRRELERVVSELIQAYERQVAKTVGANL